MEASTGFRLRSIYWLLPWLLPLLILVVWLTKEKSPQKEKQMDGIASDFSVKMTNGQPFHLSAHRGRWVLIDFWSTTCAACLDMLPELQRLYDAYREQPVDVVAIEIRGDQAGSIQIQKERGLSFSMAVDELGVASDYQVSVVPTLVFIDPQGLIRIYETGAHSFAEMKQMVVQMGIEK